MLFRSIMGGNGREASFARSTMVGEREKNVLGKARVLEVGGGVFIPLPVN